MNRPEPGDLELLADLGDDQVYKDARRSTDSITLLWVEGQKNGREWRGEISVTTSLLTDSGIDFRSLLGSVAESMKDSLE